MDFENVRKWLELIENHGLSLVLLLVIVFLWFVPWVKDLQTKSKKMGATDDHPLTRTIEIENNITTILAQISKDFECQWATVWQFHNGMLSAGGVPFMKMSVTHEFSVAGVVPRLELYQGIPISVFIDAIKDVEKDGCLHVNMKSKFASIVNSYKRDGVKSGYFVRINSTKGTMIGILSISYNNTYKKHDLERIAELKVYSARIAAHLEELASYYKHPRRRENDI